MQNRFLARLCLTAVVLVFVASCGSNQREIFNAEVSADGTCLRVRFDPHVKHAAVTVAETGDAVMVTITEEDPPAGPPYDDPEYWEVSRDIRLSEPLGDRSVIDGSTGEEVVVYPPGSTTGFPGGPVCP